jgi:Methyltransferase domain
MACSCCAYEAFFDEKQAQRDARKYRKKGLDAPARRIIGFLTEGGVAGESVLEVGGGVGAIQLELLKGGAARTTNVELSRAYDGTAEELLDEAGIDGPVHRRTGDFVELAESIDAADDVVLNKVVCCYHDPEALLGAAADHTQRRLVLTYPSDGWAVRAAFAAANLLLRFRGQEFRAYVWPIPRIVSAAESHGLRLVGEERASLVWRFAAFER